MKVWDSSGDGMLSLQELTKEIRCFFSDQEHFEREVEPVVREAFDAMDLEHRHDGMSGLSYALAHRTKDRLRYAIAHRTEDCLRYEALSARSLHTAACALMVCGSLSRGAGALPAQAPLVLLCA